MTLQDNEADTRERENHILDNRVDNPIDKKTHDTLTTVWLARYGFRLHPIREGTHQVMGDMWRALNNRHTITEPVKSLRTLHSTQGIEPEKKIMKLGGFDLLHPELKRNDKGYNIGTNPLLWWMALEVFLRTC